MHTLGTSTKSATIIRLFPGSPDPATSGLRLHTKYHMTAADLRGVRKAVMELPLPWFLAADELITDPIAGRRWTASSVSQVSGPPIGRFSICKDGIVYLVDATDDRDMFAEWQGFLTVADAVAAIWTFTAARLKAWGLVVA